MMVLAVATGMEAKKVLLDGRDGMVKAVGVNKTTHLEKNCVL